MAAAGTSRSRASRGTIQGLEELLETNGYEPRRRGRAGLELANCPFDALVDDCPAVMCRFNLALLEGVLEGFELSTLRAELDCEAEGCCVRFVSGAA